MAQQTAVEWLNENNIIICETFLHDKIPQSCLDQLINCFKINLEQAEEMHKEQIVNAHLTGLIYPLEMDASLQAEEYYNQTYKTQA